MPNISLCMIVKNEENNLENCLNKIHEYVDEIIIVDTGSCDKTKEIASKFTDNVYDFVWDDSFSNARNYAISYASYEYILVLDADEIVNEIDINKIKLLMQSNPEKVGRLFRVNEFSRNGISYKTNERINRLFSKKLFYYDGVIHEQVTAKSSTGIGQATYDIPLKIIHLGYEGDLTARKKKTSRNIELLKRVVAENPFNAYSIYQLGKSYYMEEDYTTACEYFEQALGLDLDTRLEYVQDMVETYGYTLLNCKQYQKALQLLNVYDEFKHSADFVFLVGLVLMNNAKFEEAICEFLKATNQKECKTEGVNSYSAFYNIGVIYECTGDLEKAKLYYSKCGNNLSAQQRLNEIESINNTH